MDQQSARIVSFNSMKWLLVVSLITIQCSSVFSDFLIPLPSERQAGGHPVASTAGNVGGKSTIKGNVFEDLTASSPATAALNLTKVLNDAISASAEFVAASANQTISGGVTSSTRFTSVGRTKIIDITGNVNLGGSSTRKFNIPLDSPGTDGLTSSSGAHSLGTFLVPEKSAKFDDGGTAANPVLTGPIDVGNTLDIPSTAYVTGDVSAAVPEPASLIVWTLLIGIGFVALRERHYGVHSLSSLIAAVCPQVTNPPEQKKAPLAETNRAHSLTAA
jgi:hypothetical protein